MSVQNIKIQKNGVKRFETAWGEDVLTLKNPRACPIVIPAVKIKEDDDGHYTILSGQMFNLREYDISNIEIQRVERFKKAIQIAEEILSEMEDEREDVDEVRMVSVPQGEVYVRDNVSSVKFSAATTIIEDPYGEDTYAVIRGHIDTTGSFIEDDVVESGIEAKEEAEEIARCEIVD